MALSPCLPTQMVGGERESGKPIAQWREALWTLTTQGGVDMEILRFVRCESFPEGVRMFGCICDEGTVSDSQGEAVLWVVYPTDAPPIVRRMNAMEARLVQQRYMGQQIALADVTAKAKRGETVDGATVREIINRDLFAETHAVLVGA